MMESDDDFFDAFDCLPYLATVLFLTDIIIPEERPLDTLEVRNLVRRFAEQFEIDLVALDSHSKHSEHFRKFFSRVPW